MNEAQALTDDLGKELRDLSESMKHSAGAWMVPGWDGWKVAHLLDRARAVLAAAHPDRVGAEGWKRLAESRQALADVDRRITEIGEKLDEQTVPCKDCPGRQSLMCCKQPRTDKALDAVRLDWLEQLTWDDHDIAQLIREWRFGGKRYGTGLRDAIDAAMQAEQDNTKEPTP